MFMKEHHGACASDAARHLDISQKYLKRLAPARYKRLVAQGAKYRKSTVGANEKVRDEAYLAAFREIVESGAYPARRRVLERVLATTVLHYGFQDVTRAQNNAFSSSNIAMRRPANIHGVLKT